MVVGKKTEQCQRLAKLVCPGFLYYDYQQPFVLAAFKAIIEKVLLLFKGYIKLVLRLALDTFFRKLINFGHIPITAAASFRVILNAIGGYYF